MNVFLIQLLGVILTGAGLLGWSIYAAVYGMPLTNSEQRRTHGHHSGSQVFSLPINMETLALGLLIAAGVGILTLTHFSACAFIGYWWADAPASILNFICR